jgi:c-di-GMP-binding flagellar brake protein YcgR
MQVERRKFPRLVADVVVEYSVIAKEPEKETSVTKNISAGGICLIVYEDIEINSILSLKILLPVSKSPLQAKGKVIWKSEFSIDSEQRERYDLGIEFVEIKELDRQKIFQYVFSFLH